VTRVFSFSAAALALLIVSDCSASFPTTQPTTPSPLVALAIQYPSSGLGRPLLSSFSFTAFAIDAEGVYHPVSNEVSWTTSDPTVVRALFTPSSFNAIGVGSAEVYATYRGLAASISVVVQAVPPYPYLDIDRRALPTTGSTSAARAVIAQSPSIVQDVTDAAVWSSSNTAVATVAKAGRVTGVAPGNTEITATYNGASTSYFFSVPPRTRFP
jgi:hypothetical protein